MLPLTTRQVVPLALLVCAAAACAPDAAQPPAQPQARAPAPAPALLDDAEALAAAQVRIDEGIHAGVRYDQDTHELVLDSTAAAPAVPLPAVFDVQWGSGHGGTLTFARCTLGAQTSGIERVYFRADRRERPPEWSASRVQVPTADLAPFVHLARAEARTTVEVRRRADAAQLGGSMSSSTADFFVLTRVLGGEQPVLDGEQPVLEREYAGYPGTLGSPRYAGIQVVVDAAREYLDSITTWTDVPAADLRATHFDDAFTANADVMLGDSHWWVMERSTEALGVFGTPAALPTLRRLDAEYQDPQPRQRAKIRNLLARPEHYLAGEPQVVPDKLDAEAARGTTKRVSDDAADEPK